MVASCLQKIELWYPSFGLQAVDCDHATASNRRRIVEIEHFEQWVGSGAASLQLPMFAKCDTLKEICSTCLSKESMLFVKSKPELPTRSLRFLRAAARSTSSAACLHHACKRYYTRFTLQAIDCDLGCLI